jgi:hypothetical protein
MRISFFLHILILNILFAGVTPGQNFIGMEKEQIIEEMRNSHKKFKLNTDDVNTHYRYLKYQNKIDILFFLSEDDKCTLIRKMCDYSNINDMISELDSNYKKSGKNTWTYSDKGKVYLINLLEEEWYFTVTTKLKK